MSDTPLQVNGHFESDATDQSVQRAWDRFAAPEHSDDIDREHLDQRGKRRYY
jgi:hypothetical protein